MSSIKNIKNALTRTLESNKPNVISLSGDWGIGKTYFWHEYIKNDDLHSSVSRKKYSYVSLFGIGSLDELKQAIFERTVPIEKAGERLTLSTAWDNLQDSLFNLKARWRGIAAILPSLKDAPIAKHFMPAAHKVLYLAVQDTLVCLDDLERKGENLRIQDVLGLVSELKEQRNCQIVLISNKDQINDLDKYNKFREKVVDSDYHFERTSEEVFNIGFPEENPLCDMYREKTKVLGLCNIRVIQKISYFDKLLSELCNPFQETVYKEAATSLPLLVSIHYASDIKNIPNIEFLKRSSWSTLLDDDLSEEEKKWSSLLSEYGWTHLNELDIALENMIIKGYPDRDGLYPLLEELDKQHSQGIRSQEISDAWIRYRSSLTEDESSILESIIIAYEKNIAVVHPSSLNSIVTLLRQLKRDKQADQIIDSYISKRGDWIKSVSMGDLTYTGGDKIDTRLLESITKLHDTIQDDRSLREVLDKVAAGDGYGREDEEYLDKVTEEGFFEYFNTANDKHLSKLIRILLGFSMYGDEHALGRTSKRVKSALERHANQSQLAGIKLKVFGIDPKAQESSSTD